MKKTFLFLMFLVSFGMISCSNDKDENLIDGAEVLPPTLVNEYITGKDLSKSYSFNTINYLVGHSEFNVLGYGYDVTGKYAHPAWVRAAVVDVAKLKDKDEYAVCQTSRYLPNNLGILQGTKEDVLIDLSIRRGLLKNEVKNYPNRIFNSMFIQPFENDLTFNTINYYYSFLATNKAWSVIFIDRWKNNGEFSYLNHYITDEFKKDLDELKGQEIIQKYGTHILIGIEIGRREDYIYRSSSREQLQLGLLTRPEQVFGKKPTPFVTGRLGETYDKENIYYEMIGLKTPKINAWMVDFTNYTDEKLIFLEGYGEINEKEAVLVDFKRDNALIPIYDVIKDDVKKKEVQAAFEKYLSE